MPAPPSGTVTFLYTDIEGSTRLWETQPQAMKVALARHDDILRQAIESNGGYVFETVGDAFYAAFPTAPEAVAAAVTAQRTLYAEPWPPEAIIKARMALHTGDAQEQGGIYFGPTVDRIARLLPAGYGGQTLMTVATQELARDRLPPKVELVDMGEHRLRDLSHRENIYQLVILDLPHDFPHIKTLEGRPNNLPVRTTPLIGREREVKQCRALLLQSDVRLLTLTGPGGIGKTRLALQVGAEALDDFADGVFVVALSPITDPELVASTIAQALGVREVGGQSLVYSLKDFLRDKQILLLLDNFEQLLEAAPLVWELLSSAPRLKVLVTSRAVLRLLVEQEYQVPPLSLPDPNNLPGLQELMHSEAIALFVSRAQAVKYDFRLTTENAGSIVGLCSWLDGLPLAIELAAARVKILTPQAMLSRLVGATGGTSTSPLQLLTGGGRDMPARQQTMKATIEWSYNLLDDGEKALFRRLSVFIRSCSLEATEAVAQARSGGPDGSQTALQIDVLDGLGSLVDKNLIRQTLAGGEVRFGMLETIREYGLERLAEASEEDDARRRHARFFLEMAEEGARQLSGPQQADWLNRLEAEHDNFRAALEWANAHKDADLGLRLAGALWRFWYMRGYLAEGRRWLLGLMALPEAAQRNAVRAKALNGAANLVYNQGDYATAQLLHNESLSISREIGDQRGISASLNNLGLVARVQGNTTEAKSLFEQALEINRAIDNRDWQAINLNNLGTVMYELGDYPNARTYQEDSLSMFTQVGDKWGIAMALGDLAKIFNAQGEYDMARDFYNRSLVLQHELGDRRNIAVATVSLGLVAWNQGDYSQARSLYEESLSQFRDLGDKRGIALALNGLGHVAASQGDYDRARSFYEQGLQIREELGSKAEVAGSYHNLGYVAMRRGEHEQALQLLEQSMRGFEDLGDRTGMAWSLNNLGRLAMNDGDFKTAREMFEKGLALCRDVGSKGGIAYSLGGLGQLAIREGDYLRATAIFQERLALLKELGSKWDIARTLMAFAWIARLQGQHEREVRLLGAAEAIRESIGAAWEPSLHDEYEKAIADARATLGDGAFEEAWQAGHAMSLEQAAAYAEGVPIDNGRAEPAAAQPS